MSSLLSLLLFATLNRAPHLEILEVCISDAVHQTYKETEFCMKAAETQDNRLDCYQSSAELIKNLIKTCEEKYGTEG